MRAAARTRGARLRRSRPRHRRPAIRRLSGFRRRRGARRGGRTRPLGLARVRHRNRHVDGRQSSSRCARGIGPRRPDRASRASAQRRQRPGARRPHPRAGARQGVPQSLLLDAVRGRPPCSARRKVLACQGQGMTVSRPAPATDRFFATTLAEADPEVATAVDGERRRQQDQIELIASENLASRAVLEAQGSVLTNKYAEGYPGRRYYGGCEFVDRAEQLAIDRAKKLFQCKFANVQPHSGSQANQAVMLALLQPGDVFMGMSLAAGGHLTHGSPVNLSGKWFRPIHYGVRRDDARIDMDEVERLAREHRPKLIIAGGSAYPRIIDFARFRKIADEVGAFFMVDMAHFAGLVAGGVHPSPLPHAHVVTTTTHKTLRGPRGGMILCNDEDIGKKINSAIFPGLQGGPLEHVIAAKAVAFAEALRPSFKQYAKAMLENARTLAQTLTESGVRIVSGGTDSHLMLVDLRPKNVTGKAAEQSLGRAYITCNKNGVPFDTTPFTVTSGVRLGSPAGTTRGFGRVEFRRIGELIAKVVDGLAAHPDDNGAVEAKVREQVLDLTRRFPIYS